YSPVLVVALEHNAEIEEIKRFINSARYREALDRLEVLATLQLAKWQQARINYLMAYCLHSSNIDFKRALDNYNLALENGHNEFSVLYYRGVLYMDLGDIEAAWTYFNCATSLDPSYNGAKHF